MMTSPDFGSSHVGSCEMTRPHFSSNCSRRSPRQRGGGGAPLLLPLVVVIALLLPIRLLPACPARQADKISSPSHWSSIGARDVWLTLTYLLITHHQSIVINY